MVVYSFTSHTGFIEWMALCNVQYFACGIGKIFIATGQYYYIARKPIRN